MFATWAVGAECDPNALGDAVTRAPWTCAVIVMTAAVADKHLIAQYLNLLVSPDARSGNQGRGLTNYVLPRNALRDVLNEKAVYKLSDKIFVAVHRAKVFQLTYRAWTFPNLGQNDPQSRQFGTLKLGLDTSRQAQANMVIGIVDLRGGVSVEESDELTAWAVQERLAMMTGHFGDNSGRVVENIAYWANAIYERPFFQGVHDNSSRSRGPVAHPTYYICFGFYKSVKLHDPFAIIPAEWKMGDDIMAEMVEIADIPWWPLNDEGSSFVPPLGCISQKTVNWNKWIPHVFQTCLWMGHSIPGYGSQRKNLKYRGYGNSGAAVAAKGNHASRKGNGKGNGKGDGKGSRGGGKGTGAGNGTGGGRHHDRASTNWFQQWKS